MNRKEALHKLAGSTLLTSLPALGFTSPSANSTFRDDFLHRWKTARDYSLKVLDKMPEAQLGYKPTPDQMSFGKLFSHAAHWNTFFIGSIVNQPPVKEPEATSKAALRDYYLTCHDQCTATIEKLSDHQLDQTGYGTHEYWQKHTGRDFLLRALTHTAHHRAQALVYLRLNGIEPPFFEF
ncbi:DinB family protein [Telluribacter sp. SYSU D00476]|uniref:DinB family protein n=1 Tax=Telluribacter sp. SYSU D00476 TaxID=2811430 RepID=UPI001FF2E808|nr:DinB family protein [Telluribacter sp. SYSU D00476]